VSPKFLLATLALACAARAAHAAPESARPATNDAPKADRTVDAVRRATPITVDGVLDDDAWKNAPQTSTFWQREPNEGAPPSFRTSFRVTYDDHALYVAVTARDPQPDKIRGLLTRRDEMSSSDWINIGVDSYHDRRTAFVFGVNAAGVQRDMIMFDDTQEDSSWNAVWESGVHVDDHGCTAEFRIPYSQIRFPDQPEQVWGLQVSRVVQRTNETDFWNPSPRDKPQLVSLFGELHGIRKIPPARRLEVVPYVVGGARVTSVDAGDPFTDPVSGQGTFGVDLEYGVTTDLTLSASINPDFGQVEADPSQVNLTAQETFFQEKRPFFVEGADILRFSLGQGDGGGSIETMFYSRRIGAPPHGTGYDYGDYVVEDPQTQILGAAKLSGKTGGWSIGLMNAITSQEKAVVQTADGSRINPVIEPLTSYTVAKIQRDLGGGATTIGGAVTAVNRKLDGTDMDWLHRSAYTGGLRLQHRWGGDRWTADLRVASSTVAGSAESIDETQRASQRYYQRPDADYLHYDPTRTRLSGAAALGNIGRNGKQWSWATGFDTRTPGFEVNDLGFQRGADYLVNWVWLQRHDNDPGEHFNTWSVNYSAWSSENYGGDWMSVGGNVNANATLKNYWGGNLGGNVNWDRLQTGLLRGGPAVRGNRMANLWANLWSDGRQRVHANLSGNAGWAPASDSYRGGGNLDVTVQAMSNLDLSAGPFINHSIDDNQYVEEAIDQAGSSHYVLARIHQTTAGMTLRASYTLSPDLSIQVYAQPFVAAGSYGQYKEPVAPRAAHYDDRYAILPASQMMVGDDTIGVTRPDGTTYAFGRPDFNFRELRSNVVIRWEYLPGSTLFLIWSQNRSDSIIDGRFRPGTDFADLATAPGEHVLLAKLTLWMGL